MMSTSIMAARPTQAAIDSKNDVGSPVDYSFKSLTGFDDVEDEEPRKSAHKLSKTDDGKYESLAIKFNNNTLTEIIGLEKVVKFLLVNPMELSWLDLSMNDITKLDNEILQFSSLKMLYLHGNGIMNLPEIDKLSGLPNLITLTLHGNPIDTQKGYRQYVLAKLSGIRTLDFSRVTKADRMDALTWNKMFGKKKHGRKKTQED
ncbi:leucine-rich repeat-containing protein 51-like [Amphiura filiformis]|uniref:leucine-rich repeat-containing protein 51-like n=1 Tax=Amphiura filiformis TaxID=82378 RepID=UPI003B222A7F